MVCFCSYGQETCPIIPLPEHAEKNMGSFTLSKNTVIAIEDESIKPVGDYLQTELLRLVQIPLSVSNKKAVNEIIFLYDKTVSNVSGSYSLNITKNKVIIRGRDNEGLFNGAISFIQLVSSEKKVNTAMNVACWNITDKPLYQWRGLMLDESRHFFGKEKVKQILSWMAYYKLNKFHWHLTDQHGWRIEVKQYPKLTQVGGIGNFHDEYAPAKFYTQDEIKEIIAYAKERFIEVIPEIDMPGHASAANRAYPEFSGGGSEKYPEYTFNPGKDSTYQYLTDILREIDALFPSQKIHIGGDEVHYGNETWNQLSDVKNLMQKENLKDLKEVENYFFKRISDSLIKINNKVLAWDEMANADIPANKSILFWWRHNKPEQLQTALNKSMPVVLCPRFPMYFDYKQDSNQVHGPDHRKFTLNSIENVYKFSQNNYGVKFDKKELVLGVQANLWTERIRTENRLDYMLFPRIAALAESAWTDSKYKDLENFGKRISSHFLLYEKDGLYYFNYQQPGETGEPKY